MEFKIDFSQKDAKNYGIAKIINDRDRIIRQGNTDRFVDIVVNKWVIINRDTNRVENDLNPHIEQELDNAQIRNWRLDGWYNLYIDYIIVSDSSDYGTFKVDFDTGKFERIFKKGEAKCPNCGRYIKKKYIYGHFCRGCLTRNDGLAYRFNYHSYYEGYKIPKNYSPDKVPIFGCEIERDYLSNNGDFNENLKDAMVDIIKIFHKKELKDGNLTRQNVFMRDGSLNCDGLEWITFPHTLAYYVKNKSKFDEALEKIKNWGFGNSERAGNHIHINRDYFGDDAEFCAAKMSILFNTYWDEFLAISGRDRYETGYCTRPTQKNDDSIFNVVKKTLENASDHCISINL